MTFTAKVLAGAVAVLLLGCGIVGWKLARAERRIQTLELAPAKQATVTAAARVETVTVRLAAARDTLVRVLHDTAWRTTIVTAPPVTHEDTVRSIVQLPAVVAKYDTLERRCSAYVVSCDQFRAAATAQRAADSTYIGKLEADLHRQTPGGLRGAWRAIEKPALFLAGACLGARVAGGRCPF